jgi:hypothetical protein
MKNGDRWRLTAVAVITFAVISLAGILLCLLYAPTISPARMVAFIATMFSVTGATVATAVTAALRK